MPDLVNLGQSGLLVSRIGLGTFNFGNRDVGVEDKEALRIIDAYLDSGYNYIDTANIYGDSRAESIVGKALKDRRDNVVLATKAGGVWGNGASEGGTSRKALFRAIEGSMQRLDTDYIDLYQMHVYDYHTPLAETLSTLNDFVRRGMVRHVGVSNWTASQIIDAARIIEKHGWEPLISLQPQYNILQRDIEVEIVGICQRFGMGIVPWSPLAGGTLAGTYKRDEVPEPTGRLRAFPNLVSRLSEREWTAIEMVREFAFQMGTTPVALSLAWLLRKPGVTAPLIGPETVDQLDENLAALELDLPDAVVEAIDGITSPVIPYPHNFGRRRV